jgi:DNA-binding protein Fis
MEKTQATTKSNWTQAADLPGIRVGTMRNRIRECGLTPRRYA